MTEASQETAPHVSTSVILGHLMRDVPAGQVSVAKVLGQLRSRSFGLILLLLGIFGLLPAVSPLVGVLLTIPAYQMLRGHPAPVFPARFLEQTISSGKLCAMLERLIPVLRVLERFSRPRWPTPFQSTKRVIGALVLLLGACLLAPLPLSNVPIGLVIVLTAFAYLEEDGILLAGSFVIALGLFAVAGFALWGTYSAAS